MADILKPDLCIIGGGSGGLTVAASARAFGASVVLIEKGEMGGDCLNFGCVPSKSLIAAARHAEAGRSGKAFGVGFSAPKVDFARVNAHIQGVIADIAPHDSVERFEALGVTVIKDHARFTDKRTVIAGDTTIRARRFVVATGARAAIPPIPGLDAVPYLTNETVFNLTSRPKHLVVVGAGPIGTELAQAYRRLGSGVTVVEMADALAREDPEMAEIVLRRVKADGVDVRARTAIVSVARRDDAIVVTIKPENGAEEEITGSHLLIAAGRAPNVEDMGLDQARIKTGKTGIKVNSRLRTSNRRVYAIGDVAGRLHFTHVAGYHGALVVRSTLFGLPAPVKPTIIPWATYTDPEIAHVGLTEAEASKRFGASFKVLEFLAVAEGGSPLFSMTTLLATTGLFGLVTVLSACYPALQGARVEPSAALVAI